MRYFLKLMLTVMLLCQGNCCLAQQPDLQRRIGTDQQLSPAAFEEALKQGDEWVRNGRYDEASRLYRNMLQQTTPASPYRQRIYSKFANLYNYTGRYKESVEMYYLALKHTQDTPTHIRLLVNMSAVFIDLKDYAKAMQNLNAALVLLQQHKNDYWAALAHSSKGNVYSALNRNDAARAEYHEAYQLSQLVAQHRDSDKDARREMTDFSSLVLNNIADTYLKEDMPDSALHYLQRIPSHFEGTTQYTKATVLVTLGQVYNRKGQDKLAMDCMKQALAIGEPSRYLVLNRQAYATLATVQGRQGQYKEAWNNQKRYTEINDSLLSVENIQKINNLERQYDKSVQDRAMAQKELLISKQAGQLKEQNWLAAILIFAVVSLGSIFLLSRRSHRNKQKLLKEQLNSNLKDRRIMQIEAGMKGEEKERTRIARDLHDGVVSEMLAMKLNLYALGTGDARLKASDDYRNILVQAEEVTDKLRQAAHNLMPANLQEQGLIQIVESFLKRINNHNIHFTFQHFGTLPELNEITGKIILMMTMELIQNILKHARATEAIIQFDFFDDSMSITVEDNGVGIGKSYVEHKGIGLTNIESNVSLLHGTLDIRSSEYSGTTVLIEIPWPDNSLKATPKAGDDSMHTHETGNSHTTPDTLTDSY